MFRYYDGKIIWGLLSLFFFFNFFSVKCDKTLLRLSQLINSTNPHYFE